MHILSYMRSFKVTDAVHAQGSYMFLQLWALGRTGEPSVLEKEGPYPYIAPSPIGVTGQSATPREMTVSEIKHFTQLYAKAATNAIKAGFDGVEVHVCSYSSRFSGVC
jgi:NADPH2 dehydrogenase